MVTQKYEVGIAFWNELDSNRLSRTSTSTGLHCQHCQSHKSRGFMSEKEKVCKTSSKMCNISNFLQTMVISQTKL